VWAHAIKKGSNSAKGAWRRSIRFIAGPQM
jgi:hypothetical protein